MTDAQLANLRDRRIAAALTVLDHHRVDIDKWEEHDRIDSGAAADARGSIRRVYALLDGDYDDEL